MPEFSHTLASSALLALCVGTAILQTQAAAEDKPAPTLDWKQLPPLPNKLGLGAPFVGVDQGSLIIAGGAANFPGAMPWEGGKKSWHDEVYVLDRPDGQWRMAGKLPHPLAYGVSLATPDGIACLGGSDADQHYTDCFFLRLKDGKPEFRPLPRLPVHCANFAGVILNGTIYVAGGLGAPDATSTFHTFWSLDVTQPGAQWQQRSPWPGPPRMLATMAVLNREIYLFSGVNLRPSSVEQKSTPNAQPQRVYLKDAYRLSPGSGWQQIADLPRASVAAPTPAIVSDDRILIFGGDDGVQADKPQPQHTGFPHTVLSYDAKTNQWSSRPGLPFSFATTTTAIWNDRLIIPGGEIRPGVRSNEIWSARPSTNGE